MKQFIFLIITMVFGFNAIFSQGLQASVSPQPKVSYSKYFNYVDPQAKNTVKKIMALAEAKPLLEKIAQLGKINIVVKSFGSKIKAKWKPKSRTIVVNAKFRPSEAKKLVYILFELHNAAATADFNALNEKAKKREISKKEYIIAAEKIEYDNARKTISLLNKGRIKGVFSKQASWKVQPSFSAHYKKMVKSGHASWTGKNYDRLAKL